MEIPKCFEEFGLIPENFKAPNGVLRCSFGPVQIAGQFLFAAFFSTIGIALGVSRLFLEEFPLSMAEAALVIGIFGYIVYRAAVNDYQWIELSGTKIRARHLYTRRIIERSIEEIGDIRTQVLLSSSLQTRITEALLGRIRAVLVRFKDSSAPLLISVVDPKMTNGREMIFALIYRMSEIAPIDAEVVDCKGTPIVNRIYWKQEGENIHKDTISTQP